MRLLIKAYGKKDISKLVPKYTLVSATRRAPFWMKTYINPEDYKQVPKKTESSKPSIYDDIKISLEIAGKDEVIELDPSGPVQKEEIREVLEGDKVSRINFYLKNKKGKYEQIIGIDTNTNNSERIKNVINSRLEGISNNFLLNYRHLDLPLALRVSIGDKKYEIRLNDPPILIQDIFDQISKDLNSGKKIDALGVGKLVKEEGKPLSYSSIKRAEGLRLGNIRDFKAEASSIILDAAFLETNLGSGFK